MWNRFSARITGFSIFANSSKPLAAGVLILLLVVGFCPATSVFAAYGTSFVGNVTYDNVIGQYYTDVASWGSDIDATYTAYGTVALYCSWSEPYSNGYIAKFRAGVDLTASTPTLPGWKSPHCNVVIDNVSYDTALRSLGFEQYNRASGKTTALCYGSTINQRQTIGIYINYHVVTHYTKDLSVTNNNDRADISQYSPSIGVSGTFIQGEYLSLTELLPDVHSIKQGLLDPTTGWLPIMNTNLQTMVTQQATSNSWLNSISRQMTTANSYLTNIENQQITQIGNQQTQINQLQQIVDYVNSTIAADKVNDANQNFVNEAGNLESGQANLENAADASLAAVDISKISLIGTYSQSITWWMRVINWLPSGTGALWDIVVFGFLVAFLLFILRLVR